MLEKTKRKSGQCLCTMAGLAIAAFMAVTAFASNGIVQDRRVTLAEAQAMAAKTSRVDFPVVVNDLVLKELNRFIGTPEGRDFMKGALSRMPNYETTVTRALIQYNAPRELLAVPIIESGYQNLTQEQSGTSMKAAGLWQFIPETAVNFGLRINSVIDQRLDLALETDAALRLLTADYLRFKDWQLALMAFNMGETGLQKGIELTHSHDAWTLIRKGYEGDQSYLARVMAAVLIMQNPESVQ